MIKTISLYSRKPGMSANSFRQHYEQVHLPMIVKKAPHFSEHRRNFVIPGAAIEGGVLARTAPPGGFDLLTTITFDDPAANERMRAALADPSIGPALMRDSEAHMDMGKTIRFEVEEYHTPAADLGDSGARDGAMVKMMIFISRRPDMSRADFIEYYETRHAALSARLLRSVAGYTRNYPLPGTSAPSGVDAVTEMWFRDQSRFDELAAEMARPEMAATFAEDEAKLFVRDSIQLFMVDERVTRPPSSGSP